MSFKERLLELIDGYWDYSEECSGYSQYRRKERIEFVTMRFKEENSDLFADEVDKRHFNKWKMLTGWFLVENLGPDHPYTLDFLASVNEPNDSSISAGLGILQALLEDYQRRHIKI